MQVQRVHIGGWFQRTRLHLGEMYDFLREGTSPLALDPMRLKKLRTYLDIREVTLVVDQLECVVFDTNGGISVKIYEDGLIVLCVDVAGALDTEIKVLTDYYEKRLAPAFSYLFSLGAPVPKELANIKTVYPYFVTVKKPTKKDIEKLFEQHQQATYFTVNHKDYNIYRGDKLYVIDAKRTAAANIDRFIEEQVFVREFRGQLHRYLNLYRTIWERIAEVKERGAMKGAEIPTFKTKIDEYKKTIDFIDTRINQMGSYLATRGSIADTDPRLKPFAEVLGFKHETLENSLSYMQDIWVLTQKYVDSAQKLFSDLQAQSTNSSVENLTVVTSMGVGATLIGLFAADSVPEFTIFGVAYFFALALLGFSVSRAMRWWYKRRTYEVSDTKLAKDL